MFNDHPFKKDELHLLVGDSDGRANVKEGDSNLKELRYSGLKQRTRHCYFSEVSHVLPLARKADSLCF